MRGVELIVELTDRHGDGAVAPTGAHARIGGRRQRIGGLCRRCRFNLDKLMQRPFGAGAQAAPYRRAARGAAGFCETTLQVRWRPAKEAALLVRANAPATMNSRVSPSAPVRRLRHVGVRALRAR